MSSVGGRSSGGSPRTTRRATTRSVARSLLQHLPGYDKVLHGEYALCEVPMKTLAERCPHFGAWLGHLEAIAASATE